MGFAHVGENVLVARNCTIVGLENISIGDNVRIDGTTTIVATHGHCRVGRNVHVASGCHLACGGGVDLGDFSGLSQGVKLYSTTDDYSGSAMTIPTVPAEFTNVSVAPIAMGRHVIIGSNSVVLPGVELGEGVAIGALSLVTRSQDPWTICAGTPARRIRARSQTLLELERKYLVGQEKPPS